MLSAEKAYERRWWTLGVLCMSLVVIVIDNSILNVALPTIVRDLGATGSDLQWILDSYIIVFASLLLIAGALGDKYGRKGALTIGLVLFGGFSGLAAFATSPDMLIAARALMGIGAAFIFPTTLSILTNTFDGRERATAIGVWAGVSGIGVALGPMLGGLLVEHFDWGAVFFVNIPICAAALVLGFFFIPTSRDPDNRPLDPMGALLSILTLVALLYAIIRVGDKSAVTSRRRRLVRARTDPAGRVRLVGDAHRRADDRPARVPQRAVLGRLGGAHPHVVRALRLAVPADAVLPVRARLLAVRGRAPRPPGGRRHDGDVAQRAEARVPLGHQVGRRDRIAGDRGDDGALRLEHDHVVVRRRLRRAAVLRHRSRSHVGAGDGVDHGVAAAEPRRGGIGDQRHDAPDRWRARHRRHREPLPHHVPPLRRQDQGPVRGVGGGAARLGRPGARLRPHAAGQAGRGADRAVARGVRRGDAHHVSRSPPPSSCSARSSRGSGSPRTAATTTSPRTPATRRSRSASTRSSAPSVLAVGTAAHRYWIVVAVAVGGALGTMARYELALAEPVGSGRFPWATFVANVAGSLVLGIAAVVWTDERGASGRRAGVRRRRHLRRAHDLLHLDGRERAADPRRSRRHRRPLPGREPRRRVRRGRAGRHRYTARAGSPGVAFDPEQDD